MKLDLPIPLRLQTRPRHRGLPVPFINLHAPDGTPDFRAIDEARRWHVFQERLCQLCAQKLGRFIFFTGGPNATAHRSFFEPPTHLDCLLYAMQVCPYMLGQVEHADVQAVAAKHAGHVEIDTTAPLDRDPWWGIVKATGYHFRRNGRSWNFDADGVRYVSPPLFPEAMTATDWQAMETILRHA